MPPLQVTHIGPDDIKKLPYMMTDGTNLQEVQDTTSSATASVVNQYKDPFGAQKKVERITPQNEDVNDRLNLRGQYQK